MSFIPKIREHRFKLLKQNRSKTRLGRFISRSFYKSKRAYNRTNTKNRGFTNLPGEK